MGDWCAWELEADCPAPAWEEIVRRVEVLVRVGLPQLAAAQATAPVPPGWRGWPNRLHRRALARLNALPAHVDLGLPGRPHLQVRQDPRALPPRAPPDMWATTVLPTAHACQAQWGDRLHPLAWVGTLAHLVDEPGMGCWKVVDASLSQAQWQDLRGWAAQAWEQAGKTG